MTKNHDSISAEELDQQILLLVNKLGNRPEDFVPEEGAPVIAKHILQATASNLWVLLIRTIELYSEHTDRQYTDWSVLSADIAETFEQDKIDHLDRTHLYSVIYGDAEQNVSEFIIMTQRAADYLEAGSDVTMTMIDPLNDPDTAHPAIQTILTELGRVQTHMPSRVSGLTSEQVLRDGTPRKNPAAFRSE